VGEAERVGAAGGERSAVWTAGAVVGLRTAGEVEAEVGGGIDVRGGKPA
jgi:hypothetical protein